ncbi:MAG: hypothetical protein JF564_08740, partial [Sphingomonas sp.]|nr:hypothetical protein [Sphingomonas sp.]
MLRATLLLALVAALILPLAARAQRADWIDTRPGAPGPSLSGAHVISAAEDYPVVALAAADLRRDLALVTGRSEAADGILICVGTIGRNPAIDRLIALGKLDATRLAGAWESFTIATVERPAAGIPCTLVVAGSDRRGT